MTERESFLAHEKRLEIFARDHYTCCWCGESIFKHGSQQLAHGIHKSKANLKKFGPDIIHSQHNLYSCCSLDCNSHLNVGVANEEAEAERIRKMNERI